MRRGKAAIHYCFVPALHGGVKLSLRRTKLAAYGISISYSWFSCDELSFIALILPLISSLRRVCFFISVLFVLLKLPLWHFVFLVPELLPKCGFGHRFLASTIIGDVFSHSLHFKI
jgi:hypothetical protein